VSCGSDSKIARFDGTTGEYIGDFVAAGSGGLSVCFGVDIGPNNNVFACSQKTNQIIQYDGITGDFIGIYASVTSPYDLTFAPDGTLFVTTRYDGNIYKFASDGSPLGQFNDINISPARGIDIGTDGDVYVACWDDHAGFMAGAYRFDGITGELKESLPQPNAIFCCVNGEPTLGACCTNNQASCVMSTQTDCEYFGGNFQGYSVECIDVSCQTSCLGDVTGDGQVNVSDVLVVISVWGACP